MSNPCRPDRPERASQTAAGHGFSGRDAEPQNDQAQEEHEDPHLTAQNEQVSPAPPWGEEPQHEKKNDQAEGSVFGPETNKRTLIMSEVIASTV